MRKTITLQEKELLDVCLREKDLSSYQRARWTDTHKHKAVREKDSQRNFRTKEQDVN